MTAGETVRFVHTSDWQLGMTRHFLEGEAQSRYAEARLDAVRAVGALARARDADFVVVAGDVFDSNLLSSQVVRRTLDALGEIEVPVYLLPGNHDALNAATIYRSEVFTHERPPHVRVLTGGAPVSVAEGVDIVAAPLTSNAPQEDPTRAVLAGLRSDGTRRILLAHGQVDVLAAGSTPGPGAIALAGLEAAIEDGRVHYVALGDKHTRLSVGGSGRVHYSGTPEVTDFREQLPGDALIVELDGAGDVTVEHARVGRWTFADVYYDVNCADDIASLDAELSGWRDASRTVIRLHLTGLLSLTDNACLQEVLARHGDRFAACLPWESEDRLIVHVDGDELSELGVAGYVGAAVAELGHAADADRHASDALALLYRLARTGTR